MASPRFPRYFQATEATLYPIQTPLPVFRLPGLLHCPPVVHTSSTGAGCEAALEIARSAQDTNSPVLTKQVALRERTGRPCPPPPPSSHPSAPRPLLLSWTSFSITSHLTLYQLEMTGRRCSVTPEIRSTSAQNCSLPGGAALDTAQERERNRQLAALSFVKVLQKLPLTSLRAGHGEQGSGGKRVDEESAVLEGGLPTLAERLALLAHTPTCRWDMRLLYK